MSSKESKIRPILFSTPMVQAILEGRKTQTRRVIKKKYSNTDIVWHEKHSGKTKILVELQNDVPAPERTEEGTTKFHLKAYKPIVCPFEVGDILWVRETFEYFESNYNSHGNPFDKNSTLKIKYKADGKISIEFEVENTTAMKALFEIENSKVNSKNHLKPSIFMPKDACRLFLRIKSIRVERLQDISEVDAIAEGARDHLKHTDLKILEGLGNWKIPRPFGHHQFGFLSIWCTINGCENWLENPFVWVYELERIEKPLNFGV